MASDELRLGGFESPHRSVELPPLLNVGADDGSGTSHEIGLSLQFVSKPGKQPHVINSAAYLKVVLERILRIRIVGWDGGAETILVCLHFCRLISLGLVHVAVVHPNGE